MVVFASDSLKMNLREMDKKQQPLVVNNDNSLVYAEICQRNREKIVKANGTICQVAKELIENYLDGGKNLDDESWRWLDYHVIDCENCRKMMINVRNNKNYNEEEIPDMSLDKMKLKEFLAAKKKCSFVGKYMNEYLAAKLRDDLSEALLEHISHCGRCGVIMKEKKEERKIINKELENVRYIDCFSFQKYCQAYLDNMLDAGYNDLMSNHYLTCDDCNNYIFNNLGEYTKRFCINNRSDKIKKK